MRVCVYVFVMARRRAYNIQGGKRVREIVSVCVFGIDGLKRHMNGWWDKHLTVAQKEDESKEGVTHRRVQRKARKQANTIFEEGSVVCWACICAGSLVAYWS